MATQLNSISIHEQKMYDRQIRLWGLEAQKRLRNSSILIVGTNAYAVEVAKNLVLAGINRLEIVPLSVADVVTDDDVRNVFCVCPDSFGEQKGAAVVNYLKSVNPNVQIDFNSIPYSDLPPAHFAPFDILCALETPLLVQTSLNRAARALNKPFFAGDLFGRNGSAFIDLGAAFKFASKSGETAVRFVPLHASLESPAEGLPARRVLEKRFLALIKAVYGFEYVNNRLPVISDSDEIFKMAAEAGFDADKAVLSGFLEGLNEYSPATASVMGGILAQEVIKAICGNEEPLKNWVFFGGLVGDAAVVVDVSGDKREVIVNGVH